MESCKESDIAVALACPVIGKYKNRKDKEIIIYGGAVHLSKDNMVDAGNTIFGLVARGDQVTNQWGKAEALTYVKGMS